MATLIEENAKLKVELDTVSKKLSARDKDVENLKKALTEAKLRITELENAMKAHEM